MILGVPLRADKKVYSFDCSGGILTTEELTYMGNDSLDVGVAFARSSMFLGCRHLENGEYDGVVFRYVIDGERVKKGVIGCDRGVVFVSTERHLTEVIREVDQDSIPSGESYWHWGRGLRRRARRACGEGGRDGLVRGHEGRLWWGLG